MAAPTNYYNSYPSTPYLPATTNNLPQSTFGSFFSAIPSSGYFTSTAATPPRGTIFSTWVIVGIILGSIGAVVLVSLIIWSFCVACSNNAVPTATPPPAKGAAPVKASPKKEKTDKTNKDTNSKTSEKKKKSSDTTDSQLSSVEVGPTPSRYSNNAGVTVITLS